MAKSIVCPHCKTKISEAEISTSGIVEFEPQPINSTKLRALVVHESDPTIQCRECDGDLTPMFDNIV